MAATTLGRLMINKALPAELRDNERHVTGKDFDDLLLNLARNHPDKYKEVTNKLTIMGANASFNEGTTLRLEDLESPLEDRKGIFDELTKAERSIRKSKMTDDEKQQVLERVYYEIQDRIQKQTYERGLAKGNMFARQVQAKARGNAAQLAATISTPGIFQDSKNKTIPIFVRNSYAEGLSPAEYYAATFGTRKGVISTKFATREAGDLGKQLTVAAANLIVTEVDCGTNTGIPVGANEVDNAGAFLARDVLSISRNTPIDSKVLSAFERGKVKEILVRSPLTCKSVEGVCAKCSGLNENGKLPALRDNVGVKANSALSERIAQGSLNVKHSGGQSSGKKVYAGFPIVNQLAQVPETFRHKASVAELDGKVSKVEAAPQGGFNVTIGEQQHYVDSEQDVTVKVGDTVEAGDQLSTGIANPAEIVKYKGIGEGRLYFAKRFKQAFNDSGMPAHRRNIEFASRALINHVDIEDDEGLGRYLPGDKVYYSALESSYKPRSTSKYLTNDKAIGKYIEEPVLHYTIGTRVTKSVAKKLNDYKINSVLVNDEEPGFKANMVRLRTAPQTNPDWMAKLQGSYLGSTLLKDVHVGATSNIHGTNPVPALAYGVEFGENRGNKVTY